MAIGLSVAAPAPAPALGDAACVDCGAAAPVTNREGYTVCSACGCVYEGSLSFSTAEARAPAGGLVRSRAPLSPRGTRAGLPREQSPDFARVARRDRASYRVRTLTQGYFAVRQVLAGLALDEQPGLVDATYAVFACAWESTPPRSPARNVALLAAAAAFHACRTRGMLLPRESFTAYLTMPAATRRFNLALQLSRAFVARESEVTLAKAVASLATQAGVDMPISVMAGRLALAASPLLPAGHLATRSVTLLAVAIAEREGYVSGGALSKVSGVAASAIYESVRKFLARCGNIDVRLPWRALCAKIKEAFVVPAIPGKGNAKLAENAFASTAEICARCDAPAKAGVAAGYIGEAMAHEIAPLPARVQPAVVAVIGCIATRSSRNSVLEILQGIARASGVPARALTLTLAFLKLPELVLDFSLSLTGPPPGPEPPPRFVTSSAIH